MGIYFLCFSTSALAEVKVGVRLFDTTPAPVVSKVILSGRYRFKQPNGLHQIPNPLIVTNTGNGLVISVVSNHRISKASSLRLMAIDSQGTCIDRGKPYAKRCYAGEVNITPGKNGTLQLQNTVSRREYLNSVLASEILPDWPLEALKAQTVISQTRLARHPVTRSASGEQVILLSDSTTDEAYAGVRKNVLAEKAVNQVWGEILVYNKQPIEAFYHSTCAGHTSDDGYFSGGSKPKNPYSVGVKCPYCLASPFYKVHTATIPMKLWNGRFSVPIHLNAPDAAGRFRQTVSSPVTPSIISAYLLWLKIGQSFGWDKVPGTWMSMKVVGENMELKSRGAGHGVGLCQWGAAGMARQGFSYRDILRHYYPKAMLHRG